MKMTFEVTIDIHNVSVSDVRSYIRDAVLTYGGCFHPDDPLFTGNWRDTERPVQIKHILTGE